MDEYSKSTIRLLLKRDRTYLREILVDISGEDNVPAELNIDVVCAIITTRRPLRQKKIKSSIYTCKCGSNDIRIREMQTRSVDEGSTIFYICMRCGHTCN